MTSWTKCAYCGRTFTYEEWEDRHTSESGEDIHAVCCNFAGPCAKREV